MGKSLDHVCILVKDIDQAISHYAGMLGVLTPKVVEHRTEVMESYAGQDRYLTVIFAAQGDGCNI